MRLLIASDGSELKHYDYDAFGVIISQGASPVENNYLYAGEQWDSDLEMYFLRARYYDAKEGRFWTMDSYEGMNDQPQSLHKYLYAELDPVNLSDPSGLMAGSVVEPLMVVGIRVVHFAVRVWPVVKGGLMVWDGIIISRILYKSFTGQEVSNAEWAQLGIATAGIVGGAPGAKLLAKLGLQRLIEIPINASIRTFEGAKLAVGQIVKLKEITKMRIPGTNRIKAGGFVVEGGSSSH